MRLANEKPHIQVQAILWEKRNFKAGGGGRWLRFEAYPRVATHSMHFICPVCEELRKTTLSLSRLDLRDLEQAVQQEVVARSEFIWEQNLGEPRRAFIYYAGQCPQCLVIYWDAMPVSGLIEERLRLLALKEPDDGQDKPDQEQSRPPEATSQ